MVYNHDVSDTLFTKIQQSCSLHVYSVRLTKMLIIYSFIKSSSLRNEHKFKQFFCSDKFWTGNII